MSRGYVELDGGQLHYHRWGNNAEHKPVLVCFPPVPYGGRYFVNLAEALSSDADVIAVDPPGFGASDPLPGTLTIDRQAEALLALADALGIKTANWLGFHSGALVTLEVGVSGPARVDRLFLIDVPAFPTDERRSMLEKTARARSFTRDLSGLESIWDFNVARHGDEISIERGLENLIQDLQAGAAQPQGFRAAFSHDIEKAVASLDEIDIILIATRSRLLEATRNLRQLLIAQGHDGIDYQEWLDVDRLVFDLHAGKVADTVRSAFRP